MSLRKDLGPLTNVDLLECVDLLKIKNFRGVFMRDTLPCKILSHEVGIVNLDSSQNKGTHWVCYKKSKERRYYFDSFGLDPPEELITYLKGSPKDSPKNSEDIDKNKIIEFSTFQIQDFGTHQCGYYCLLILKL